MNLVTQSGAPGSVVFSFKLVGTLKSDCLEIGWIDKNNALSAGVYGALLVALEKAKVSVFVPRVVPITASGLQGSEPLVIRTKPVREAGKLDPKFWEKDWR